MNSHIHNTLLVRNLHNERSADVSGQYRTRVCKDYKRGCKFEGCTFAHNSIELKVKMCAAGKSCAIPDCKYNHSDNSKNMNSEERFLMLAKETDERFGNFFIELEDDQYEQPTDFPAGQPTQIVSQEDMVSLVRKIDDVTTIPAKRGENITHLESDVATTFTSEDEQEKMIAKRQCSVFTRGGEEKEINKSNQDEKVVEEKKETEEEKVDENKQEVRRCDDEDNEETIAKRQCSVFVKGVEEKEINKSNQDEKVVEEKKETDGEKVDEKKQEVRWCDVEDDDEDIEEPEDTPAPPPPVRKVIRTLAPLAPPNSSMSSQSPSIHTPEFPVVVPSITYSQVLSRSSQNSPNTRTIVQTMVKNANKTNITQVAQDIKYYKTRMCKFGKDCNKGKRCTYAHIQSEIRPVRCRYDFDCNDPSCKFVHTNDISSNVDTVDTISVSGK